MTDQERQDAVNVWSVRQRCLDHAMTQASLVADANAVAAYATILEAYVLRPVVLNTVTEPAQ